MPTLNPKNRNISVGFSGNAYVGQRAQVDQMTGYVTNANESRTQVLDYKRVREELKVTKTLGNHPVSGVMQPGFGLIWSDFLDNQGRMSSAQGIRCRNKAYSRFKDKVVGSNSTLGVLAAERREAYGMIANRALGLYRAYRDLRRGNFRDALKQLSVDPKRKHRNKLTSAASEASSLWLEYWFGWSPTVNDLYGLGETLTKDLPDKRYSGSAKEVMKLEQRPNQYSYDNAKAIYRARTGATVRLTNPDVFLLQSLGLANPASILWETIPFSFVADWFFRFGDVIDSCTDFVGLAFTDTYQSYKLEKVERYGVYYAPGYYDEVTSSFPGHAMFRDQGNISPTIAKPIWLDTWKSQTRAATAVSLLTQALTSK